MDAIKYDEKYLPDYNLSLDVGDTLSSYGLTRVQVKGSGQITAELQVVSLEAEKSDLPSQEASCQLKDSAGFFKRALQLNWSRKFPPRPGIPDEAIIVWTLRHGEKTLATMKTWLRDAEKEKDLEQLIAELREEISRASDGKIYL